jgi:hypothetical protein
MFKNIAAFCLGFMVVTGVAYATPALQRLRVIFAGGLTVANTAATQVSGNTVTKILAGSETVDFASLTTTCADSTGHTVTGAAVGDRCVVSAPAAPGNENFTCYVSATNTVKVHACAAGTAVDAASGSYKTLVFSTQ